MHKIRKSIICTSVIFLFSFWGSPLALMVAKAEASADTPADAPSYQPQQPGKGAILFYVSDPEGVLAGRSITATASFGPADDAAARATLSGLNDFTAAVELPPGDYFCTAAVDYDPARDYPLVEQYDLTTATVKAGETTVLTYAVDATGYYQSITGKNRYFQAVELEQPPAGYDPTTTAQIGVYLTAPEDFNHTVTVYLANRYTGTGYTLAVYSANQLAALDARAESGKYQYLGAYLPDDDAGRYQIVADQDILTTAEGATFHLVVTDTGNPSRKLVTPSRTELETAVSTAETTPGPAAPAPAAKVETEPSDDSHERFHFPILETLLLGGLGCFLLISYKKKPKE